MNRTEFESHLQKVLEGTSSREEFEEFEKELRRSLRARTIYREACLLESAIRSHSEQELDQDPAFRKTVLPVKEYLARQRRKTLFLAFSAAAILMLCVGITLHFFRTRDLGPAVSMRFTPESRFTIIRKNPDVDSPSHLGEGDRINLTVGTTEFTFSSGATAIINGPALLQVIDPLKLRMEYGAGYFDVPKEAIGFRVEIPGAEVVDLGTRFGIESRQENAALPEVHVFKGSVQIFAKNGLRKIKTLHAEEAVRISIAGRLVKIPVDPKRFHTALPYGLPHLTFSLEPGVTSVTGSLPSASAVKVNISDDGPSFVPGIKGMAASFSGASSPIVTDWTVPVSMRPLTICAWIRQEPDLPHRQFQTIVGWGDASEGSATKVELLLRKETPQDAAKLQLTFGTTSYTGQRDLADGRWHHIAAVVSEKRGPWDEGNVWLYVDGMLEQVQTANLKALVPLHTGQRQARPHPLMIGHLPQEWNGRYFRGEIDELTIYEIALWDKKINELSNPPE